MLHCLYVYGLVILLIASLTVNCVGGYVLVTDEDYIYQFLELNEAYLNSLQLTADLANTSMNYCKIQQMWIDDQQHAIDNLSMMNLAWSLYYATGNVSWLPQSPDEYYNVTDIK